MTKVKTISENKKLNEDTFLTIILVDTKIIKNKNLIKVLKD